MGLRDGGGEVASDLCVLMCVCDVFISNAELLGLLSTGLGLAQGTFKVF